MDYRLNEHGVFSDSERVEFPNCSILLAEEEERWYYGYEADWGCGGVGAFPSIHGESYPSRQAAQPRQEAGCNRR